MERRSISMRRQALLALLLAAVLALSTRPHSPAGLDAAPATQSAGPALRLTGQVGGTTAAVAAVGDAAYLGSGPRMLAFDVSDPTDPNESWASEPLPHLVRAIELSDERAFVAIYGGFRMVDIANPVRPRVQGGMNLGDRNVPDLALDGDTLYVVDDAGELFVFDVAGTGTIRPRRLSVTPFGGSRVVAEGGVAYTAAGPGVVNVVDATDPSAPVLAGTIGVDGEPTDLRVADGFLFVVTTDHPTAGDGGLTLFDLADPADPVPVGHLVEGFGPDSALDVSGDHAFVVDAQRGLSVIDVADRSAPVKVGGHLTPGLDIDVAGGHAYIAGAGDATGLHVIDVTDPASPVPVGAASTPGRARDVAVDGGYTFLADPGFGLRAYELHPSHQLRPLGGIGTGTGTGTRTGGAAVVASADGYAYVTGVPDDDPTSPTSMYVVDVTDPAAPVERGTYSFPGPAHVEWDLAAGDDHAYLVSDDRLRVIDVADPDAPVAVGSLALPGNAIQAEYADATVYVFAEPVGTWKGGVVVVDVSDPAAPTEVARIGARKIHAVLWSAALAVVGERLYLAEWLPDDDDSASLRVLDISDPTAPRHMGEHLWRSSGGESYQLSVALFDDFALVAGWPKVGGTAHLRMIDAQDPANMVEITAVEPPSWYEGHDDPRLAAADGRVYLALGRGGLLMYDVSFERPSRRVDPGGDAPLDLPVIAQAGGTTLAVAVEGDLAYAGSGPRVVCYDVSDPAAPAVVGRTPLLPGDVQGVDAVGDTLYVSTYAGLGVLDVSDPAHPTMLGALDTRPSNAAVVVVEGDYAYVGDATADGITIVDISDPTAPVRVGDIPIVFRGIAVSGSYLYTGDGWSVTAVDISDPTSPSWSFDNEAEANGYVEDVFVQGDFLYAASDENSGRPGGLMIYDLTDPAHPAPVGRLDTPLLSPKIVVNGDYAFVTGGTDGNIVFDVSDPAAPALVTWFAPWRRGVDLEIVGDTLYAAVLRPPALHVIDLRDPTAPTELAVVPARPGLVLDVEVRGGHAYAADYWFGLRIYDAEARDWPADVGRVAVERAGHVTVSDGLAFVSARQQVDGSTVYTGTLHVVDVADPADPRLVGRYDFPGEWLGDVAVRDDHVFVDGIDYGDPGTPVLLHVLDVSDPTAPREIGSADIAGLSVEAELKGDLIFLHVGHLDADVAWRGGVAIVDISDPTRPFELSRIASTYVDRSLGGDLAVDGDTLLFTEWVDEENLRYATSLRVFDVGDPAEPSERATYTWRRTYAHGIEGEDVKSSVAVMDGLAYITGRGKDAQPSYVQVVDVSDPEHPWGVGMAEIPASYGDAYIHAGDGRLYLARDEGGLLAMEAFVPEPDEPPLVLLNQAGGSTHAMAQHGGYLYVGSGPRVVAHDLADPGAPRPVGRSPVLPGVVNDLVVRGSHAYAATFRGLQVLDLSDAGAPRHVGSFGIGATDARFVAVESERAYLYALDTEGDPRLWTLDVSEPAQPRQISRSTVHGMQGMTVSGGHLYAFMGGANYGLRVIDVRDPEHLIESDQLADRDRLRAAAVQNGYLYALGVATGGESGLLVYDLTDPARPIRVADRAAPVVTVSHSSAAGFVLDAAHAYLADADSTAVMDISDPLDPQPVGGLEDTGGAHLAVMANHLYVGATEGGYAVVDVADRAAPHLVGSVDTPGRIPDVAVEGDYVHVVDRNFGLRIYDATAERWDGPVGSLRFGGAGHVATHGDWAYVTGRVEVDGGPRSTIRVVDVSHPQSPELVATLTMPDPWIGGLRADADGHLYVAGSDGFHVIDVSDPTAPAVVGSLPLPLAGPKTMRVHDGHAYVVLDAGEGWLGGLIIIDVSDPRNPREAARIELGRADDEISEPLVAVADATLVLSDHRDPNAHGPSGRLLTYDVADPATPVLLGEHYWYDDADNGGALVQSLEVMNGVAYIVGTPERIGSPQVVRAVDLTDPASPRAMGALELPSWPMHNFTFGIAAGAGRLYLANDDVGLLALAPEAPLPPTHRLWLPVTLRNGGPDRIRDTCRSQPLHVTFAVDTSERMIDPLGPGGDSKIQAARTAIGASLELLDLGRNSVGVVRFDRQAGRLVAGSDDARIREALTGLGPRAAPRRIDLGLRASAMDVDATLARTKGRGAVVLLYGGAPDPGSERLTLDEADRLRRAGVVLVTAALGAETDPGVLWSDPDEAEMARAHHVRDAAVLAPLMVQVVRDLVECEE